VTGFEGRRVYLDWNATAPLRPEAREAMLAAMDAVGNPSSVHAEGRAARAIVEKARGQVAGLVGCEPDEVVFTSGATEAVALAAGSHDGPVHVSPASHDCLAALIDSGRAGALAVGSDGRVRRDGFEAAVERGALVGLSWANGETGVVEHAMFWRDCIDQCVRLLRDAAQAAGRLPVDAASPWSDFVVLSSGKIGGSAGCGALVVRKGISIVPLTRGGGQEAGRRPGTENVIGIAGFGAAAEAARRDLEARVWERVAGLRDNLEEALAAAAPDLHVVGKETQRLPNTSCFAVRGWKGETQVMQMDLAGFAVSAGSACSSGKVNKASRVLRAMGYDEEMASSAIRVSLGPTTREAEVMAFAETWIERYRRRRARAA
jgi:cysteine desulfurase